MGRVGRVGARVSGRALGIEGAAEFYFGKSVRGINMAEAAMLAGLFKAPTKYAPHVNLAASRARGEELAAQMDRPFTPFAGP